MVGVSADPPAGGSVSGGGIVTHGDTVTVIATANTGYTFVNWTEGSAEVSTNAEYAFTATADRTLVAHFIDNTPPEIVASANGPMGNNNWYMGNVTVSWTVSDPDSPVTFQVGCDPVVVNYDSAGVDLTCSATSQGSTAGRTVRSSVMRRRPRSPAMRRLIPTGRAGTTRMWQSPSLVAITCRAWRSAGRTRP